MTRESFEGTVAETYLRLIGNNYCIISIDVSM